MTPEEARAELERRLKSGDYTQGKHVLKVVYPDGHAEHCCLGVAGDIGVEQGIGTWVPSNFQPSSDAQVNLIMEKDVQVMAFCDKGKNDTRADLLTSGLRRLFGFRSRDGSYEDPSGSHVYDSLAKDNDAGVSFVEIAERIATDKSLLYPEQ